MKKFLIVVSFFYFLFNSLQTQANQLHYEEYVFQTAWLKLLHYQKTLNGYQGLVTNKEFYVDSNGKDDPLKELKTEIAIFNTKDNQVKCRFPARFEWLKAHDLVSGDLLNCTEYQSFIDDVRPQGITILFTNAYMSNPASLFGHTLIRIDTARKGSQMLGHGSNFGADAGDETGFVYALKGLLGGYDGVFSINPYWDIINQYNNIENRDIWEYNLNLTDEEKNQFVNHLFEMQQAKIQYFFLSKNCSYMLLELLEVIRPTLRLTENHKMYAIPIDTLKTIKNVPDLVNKINYRPARYTKIKAQINKMNPAQYNAFKRGIENNNYDMAELPLSEQTLVLETLYQYYQYQYIAKQIDLAPYRRNSFAVLRKRSKMPIEPEPEIKGEDPTLSHGSQRLALKNGVSRHRSFAEIIFRPAYTSLTDNHFGLIKGAAIDVLESKWRYYYQQHRLVMQNFTALHLFSLVPSDEIFKSLSYQTRFELKREYNPQTLDEGYVANAIIGFGKTYVIADYFWVYALLNITGEYGGFIPNNQFIALEPEVGIYTDFKYLQGKLNVRKNFATTNFGQRLIYQAEITGGITDNTTIALEYTADQNQKGHNSEEFSLSLSWYF